MARRNRRGGSKKGPATTVAIDPLVEEEASRHYNRAGQLCQWGQLVQAESAYRQSIALNPRFPGSHNNLGNLLKDQGKLRPAEKAYRRALSLAPDHPMLLNNIGNVLFLQHRYLEAEEVLEQAIAQDPRHFQAHSNLGNVLMALNRPGDAITSYRRALEIDSTVPELYGNLGKALGEQERYQQSSKCLEKAVELDPDNARYRHELGLTLVKMQLLDEAEQELSTACRLAPDDPGIRFHYAFALVENGRVESAVEQLRLALDQDHAYTEAHCSLAKLCDHADPDDDVLAMERLFTRGKLPKEQQANLAFGLGKAYDDMHRHATAFDWFSKANALARRAVGFDFEAEAAYLRRILAFSSWDLHCPVAETVDGDATPIVIAGMSRTGKSLVEKLLCLHPQVAPRGETGILRLLVDDLIAAGGEAYPQLVNHLDASACAALANDYVRQLRAGRLEQTHITDTHPNNVLYIGLLLRCLPGAKVIVCRRASEDTCLSMYKKNYVKGHGYSNDMTDLGRYCLLHEQLLDRWTEMFPDAIYEASFEALIRSPEEEAEALADFCGLPRNGEFSDQVQDFGADPRRWPRPEAVIDIWKPYEEYLQPLLSVLNQQGN